MRKNTARHWLHAGLDLLPLILIPVFMVYSHRHTIEGGSIEVPVNKVVEIQQDVINGMPNNIDNISIDDGAISIDGKYLLCEPAGEEYTISFETNFNNQINDIFIYSFECRCNNGYVYTYVNNKNFEDFETTFTTEKYQYRGTLNVSFNEPQFNLFFETDSSAEIKNVQLFNLTQMYGSGNEPTIEQFNNTWKQDYYDVNSHAKTLVKGISTQIYNDTDIMSQFTYQLYNSVDKYFNMGNVFGMSNVYDWFNLNIFGGNASISIYIVWNIVLYEFVMDLLFLLYALFMWFIDVTKRLIEKPLDSIK